MTTVSEGAGFGMTHPHSAFLKLPSEVVHLLFENPQFRLYSVVCCEYFVAYCSHSGVLPASSPTYLHIAHLGHALCRSCASRVMTHFAGLAWMLPSWPNVWKLVPWSLDQTDELAWWIDELAWFHYLLFLLGNLDHWPSLFIYIVNSKKHFYVACCITFMPG